MKLEPLATPICLGCRFVLALLDYGEIVFYDGPAPPHLSNCPAREPAGTLHGMKVLTHIELPFG